jgi:aspartyl protease family protein
MRISILYIIFLLFTIFFTDCYRQSERRNGNNSISDNNSRPEQTFTKEHRTRGGKSIVKMNYENGVYYVPCKINGTEMKFIFDTGASDISISATEAIFLYKQGKLTDNDFIDTQQYQIADGSIQEGTIVVFRTVEIGNRTLKNVRASIVHNYDAPLLLGQSALSKFGKISIDYDRNEISFE